MDEYSQAPNKSYFRESPWSLQACYGFSVKSFPASWIVTLTFHKLLYISLKEDSHQIIIKNKTIQREPASTVVAEIDRKTREDSSSRQFPIFDMR